MKAFIVNTDERFQEQGTSIQNLEKRVGHIEIILSERIPGTLPIDTERNPKETVNVVTLRSGQVFKDLTPIQKDVRPKKESGEKLKSDIDKKKKGQKESEKKKKEENLKKEEPEESKHIPALPFPQKLCREKLDKFLKEILTKKRKVEETSVEIGEGDWRDKVCTHIIIDGRSDDYNTQGIMQHVLVRVDKFVFPVDFIVVNMEKNKEVPLILGRLFLATGITILDIQEIKLMLRVGEETVTFKMNGATGVKKDKPIMMDIIDRFLEGLKLKEKDKRIFFC
ncbi:uncharacterized protein [Nicotiana tomentosiformis]|uniref:uncharacterized protein n=1 Tax=Nicotiana tomentosiformis TaxID=4098 RepID=UPI00388C74ED